MSIDKVLSVYYTLIIKNGGVMIPDTFDKLFENYNTHLVNNGLTTNKDNFSAFLEMSGYSTKHIDMLYNNYTSGTEPTIEDFGVRKKHPFIRFLLQKALPTAAVVGAIGGVACAAFGSAVVPAGSNFLWMEMGSNSVTNFIKIFAETGIIGAVGSVGTLTGKYINDKNKYSSRNSLEQLKSGIDVNNTDLAKVMELINANEKEILNLREGQWYTAPFRWIKSKALLSKNAVKTEFVYKAYKDLIVQFYNKLADKAPTDLEKYNDTEMQNIYKLLKQCGKFVHDDLEQSMVYTLLSCKENDKHNHIIENANTYSQMRIYEEAIRTKFATDANITKNLVQKACARRMNREKNIVAGSLINKKAVLLQETLNEYEKLAPIEEEIVIVKETVAAEITSFESFYGGTKFTLDNKKYLIVNDLDSSFIESVSYKDSEVRVTFNTSAPDTIYPAGKELSKSAVEKIIKARRDLDVILNYIKNHKDELIRNIPTTDKKLDNLCVSIKEAFNTSASFKLTGAAQTLYNKVIAEYNADLTHAI